MEALHDLTMFSTSNRLVGGKDPTTFVAKEIRLFFFP
jgi:hypothetical protein